VAGDVQAHLVQQPEGAHGHAEAQQRLVHLGDGRALLEEESRLVQVRRQDPVDQEAGPVAHDDRRLPQPQRQGEDGGHRLVRRVLAPDDLHQGHAVDRVEEVHPGEPFSGRSSASCISVMESDDVLDVRTASGPTTASTSRSTLCFTSIRSTTASITRSTVLKPA
jgi:hypothetical protein